MAVTVESLVVPVRESSERWMLELIGHQAVVCETNSDAGPGHVTVLVFLPMDKVAHAACRHVIVRWRLHLADTEGAPTPARVICRPETL